MVSGVDQLISAMEHKGKERQPPPPPRKLNIPLLFLSDLFLYFPLSLFNHREAEEQWDIVREDVGWQELPCQLYSPVV
jgi:hypothetical protein